MNDLATLNASARTIRIKGQSFRIYPLTFADYGELQAYIDSRVADLLDMAYRQSAKVDDEGNPRYGVDQRKFLLKAALEVAARVRPLLGTPEANAILDSNEGTAEALYLSIRKGDPGFTRETAEALFRTCTREELDAALRAVGFIEPDTEGDDDPKAGAGSTTTTSPGSNPTGPA